MDSKYLLTRLHTEYVELRNKTTMVLKSLIRTSTWSVVSHINTPTMNDIMPVKETRRLLSTLPTAHMLLIHNSSTLRTASSGKGAEQSMVSSGNR